MVLVWDVALETRDYEKVENCLLEKIQYFESHYSLTPEIEIIQFSSVRVTISKLLPGDNKVRLESGRPDRSELNVSSPEYEQFEDALLQQSVRLGARNVIAPTIIRFSVRQISRPDEYARLLYDISQNVGDLSVFEYQARKEPSQNKPWLSEPIMRKKGLRFQDHRPNVIKENFSYHENQIEKFFKQISWHLEDGFRRQDLFGPALETDVVVDGISGSGRPTTAPSVTAGASKDLVPPPAVQVQPWPRKGDSSIGNEEIQRPTRTIVFPQKVVPNEIDATVLSLVPVSDDVQSAAEEVPAPPPTPRAESLDSNRLLVTADAEQTERVPVADQKSSQPNEDVVFADAPTSGRMKKGKERWKPKRLRSNKTSEELVVKPIQSSEDETDCSAETLPEDEPPSEVRVEKEDVAQMSKNGNLIVVSPSTINAREWWAKNKNSDPWFKIPNVGPSRDVEFEYGGVESLRLLAGSVRGDRHQFYGEPNQDAFAIGKNEKFLIVVVCDGVGNAKYSAYGSKFISYSVSRSLVRSLEEVELDDRDAIRVAITQAVQKASDQVQTWNDGALFAPDETASEVDREDLSATLVVAVIEIQPSGIDGRQVVVANVGDSPCYTFMDSTWELRTAATKDGEVLEHATSALPSEVGLPIELEFHEFVMGYREQLVLMTDGIGTSLASGRTSVGRWLGERLKEPQLAVDFLNTISFDRQGEDDDRTLVVLYDLDHAFTPPPEELNPDINAEQTNTDEFVENGPSVLNDVTQSNDIRVDNLPAESRRADGDSVD